MATSLPKKLKKDSIVEALLEVQFRSTDFPDIIVGKLAAVPAWEGFAATSLPASNIPPPARRMNPNFSHMPVIEKRASETRYVRFGEQVISCHRTQPYPGWETFGPEAHEAINALFRSGVSQAVITRLGLRYVNAFTLEEHGVGSARDAALTVRLREEAIDEPFTLTVRRSIPNIGLSLIRITSKDLIKNPMPRNLALLYEIDVFTDEGFICENAAAAHDWIERAHAAEKIEYMNAFTDEMRARLVEN